MSKARPRRIEPVQSDAQSAFEISARRAAWDLVCLLARSEGPLTCESAMRFIQRGLIEFAEPFREQVLEAQRRGDPATMAASVLMEHEWCGSDQGHRACRSCGGRWDQGHGDECEFVHALLHAGRFPEGHVLRIVSSVAVPASEEGRS